MRVHLDRWRALVRERREQMDRQLAALGGPPEDWWADRASFFTRGTGDAAASPPPGLEAIVERLERHHTLIDVGAGAGRYAVPLARALRHVTLVEPSPAMGRLAREQLDGAGLDNWTLVEDGWLEANDLDPASAVLFANVLNPHEDLEAWISKGLALARGWLFIVHGSIPEVTPHMQRVARELHGEERVPQPGISHLIPALHDLDVYPDVVMYERRFARSYADAGEAAREIASTLLIEPTGEALSRIRAIVEPDLRTTSDGRVALPAVTAPHALLTWRTAGRGDSRRWRWLRD
ncbi:MAG: class I SAM-dependent methyltransferase [Chloroflexi bacterium]|nr:class I SAM-dependent methyltransferase [Chloroflexota bacterium]